jgi:hypothetical protein
MRIYRKPSKKRGRIVYGRRPVDRVAARVTNWRKASTRKRKQREAVPPAPHKIGGFVNYRGCRIEMTPLYSYQITGRGLNGRKYRRTYRTAIELIDTL